jgi:hypothetical protein
MRSSWMGLSHNLRCEDVKTIRFGRIRVAGEWEHESSGGDGEWKRYERGNGGVGISSDAGLRKSHAFRVG